MIVQRDSELQALKKVGKVVALTLQEMLKQVTPGITTAELDRLGEKFLLQHGARSAPKLTYDFPGATCISINEEAAHGIPGSRVIQAGDLVNIDVSAELGGFVADTGASMAVPPVSKRKKELCLATRKALNQAIQVCRAGASFSVIGREVQKIAQKHRLKILRNLGSHGVGRSLHEKPNFIPSYFDPGETRKFKEGLVITVEPFLSTRVEQAYQANDGWTLKGPSGNFSAQYEHTIVITKGSPIILTKG